MTVRWQRQRQRQGQGQGQGQGHIVLYLGSVLAAVVLGALLEQPIASADAAPRVSNAPVATSSVGQLHLVASTTSVTYGWRGAEVWNDADPTWPPAHYLPTGRDDQTGQNERLFGTRTPPPSEFVLYQAPGATTNSGPAVLLVMGSNDSATREYADPNLGGSYTCGTANCPTTGLMQYLAGNGYRVFAVNFANKQGDNFDWAQTISDALQVVQNETGLAEVDLVAWSKGAFAARMYVSSVTPPWGRPYQGNVAKLVLIGNPNGGLDYTFAHGDTANIEIYPQCGGDLNGPSPSQSYECYGIFYTEPNLSIDSVYFTGQRQMLARWDNVYGIDETQDTWYTTYYGGQGYTSDGNGIQYAIDHGSLVSTIQQAGTPASVPTYLVCGGSATIPDFYNEDRGPSDGVVFVASCEDTTGINDAATVTLFGAYNHLMLGWKSASEAKIASWLS